MKNLTLRELRVFELAATLESFSRAADALDVSQAAVSMHIKKLEKEVGVSLFKKQSRHVVLTDAGRALLAHVHNILAQVRMAEDAITGLQGVFAGQLHLGVISPAHYFAPWLMQAFRARYPHARMKLTVATRDVLLDALQEHRLDVAIAGFPPAHAMIEAETFARHPHYIIAPGGHRLADNPRVTWEDLRDEPFVYREAGSATRQFLEQLLQARKLQVNVTTELQGNETIKQAVMAGMGIGFMSAHAFQVELATGRLVILNVEDMPKVLDWCLLYRRDSPLSGINALFRTFLLEHGARIIDGNQAHPAQTTNAT